MAIETGMIGRATAVVTDAMTAAALGSGDLPVYGTPGVLALMEQACCDALRAGMAETQTSVGIYVELEHLAATKPGATVEATAMVDSVEGRVISFTAEAREGDKLLARLGHRRALVDRAKFLSRL